MRVGESVYLKFSPQHIGTVSRVSADGRFRVTWKDDGRQARRARARFWYDRDALVTGMKVGRPA